MNDLQKLKIRRTFATDLYKQKSYHPADVLRRKSVLFPLLSFDDEVPTEGEQYYKRVISLEDPAGPTMSNSLDLLVH